MNDPHPHEWHRLFGGALNGTLNEAEKLRLTSVLDASAEARQLWFLYHDNECGLSELKSSALPTFRHAFADTRSAPSPRQSTPWLQWRSLTSAAAGLALGLLGASVVFGLVVNRRSETRRPVAVFEPGFEQLNMTLAHGFPNSAGRWGGDAAHVVLAEGGVTPKEGKAMLRLAPLADGVPRIYQVLDLRALPPVADGDSREIEFSASFLAADLESSVRYAIRAFAVVEAPEDLEATWFDRRDEAISSATRGMDVTPATKGWQTLTLRLHVPASARSLVLFLGVRTPDKAARTVPHYVDDVRVSLITPASMP